jgi:hypothetical protein
MVVGSHKSGIREYCLQRRKGEMEKELGELRVEMEKLALKMQQKEKVRWRYEWPLKRIAKWFVWNLLARRQQHVLKRWL